MTSGVSAEKGAELRRQMNLWDSHSREWARAWGAHWMASTGAATVALSREGRAKLERPSGVRGKHQSSST